LTNRMARRSTSRTRLALPTFCQVLPSFVGGRPRSSGQLVGAISPQSFCVALYRKDPHHAQRVLNFAKHHLSSPLLLDGTSSATG
jgi:hypothetical protein